jgi:DNA topoisomerase IB
VHCPRIGQELLQDAVHAPRVASALRGLLALDGIELLQHLDRNREVIVFKFEDRLRVVQQNVRIQNVGLGSNLYVMLR